MYTTTANMLRGIPVAGMGRSLYAAFNGKF